MPHLLHESTRAAQAYYAQPSGFPLTATNFYGWLGALPAGPTRGFTTSQAEPGVLRYCLEGRGYAICFFMAEHLLVAACELWAAHGEFNGDLPVRAVRR